MWDVEEYGCEELRNCVEHPLGSREPCHYDLVKASLDARECGDDGRSGSYRLKKYEQGNDDGPPLDPPPHLACGIVAADAQVLYCDPKSTHRLDPRTSPLEITVRDLGQLLIC
jgi:hypothetical protein